MTLEMWPIQNIHRLFPAHLSNLETKGIEEKLQARAEGRLGVLPRASVTLANVGDFAPISSHRASNSFGIF